jgi:acyl-CoA thioesterase FadM
MGHVNNVRYNRWAESSRVNWVLHYGALDPIRRQEWNELMTPKGVGLILRSIRTDYKFVRPSLPPPERIISLTMGV